MNNNNINTIMILLILLGGIAFANFLYQNVIDDSVFTSFEKELLSIPNDSLAYTPEEEQMMWTQLVSDNVKKSGYDINEDTLILDVKTVFYTNDNELPLPLEYIEESFKVQENLLQRSGLKIQFKLRDIHVILGKPGKNDSYNISDRYSYDVNYYSIKHLDPSALTVVIFNDPVAQGVGMSFGIPSNLIKLEMKGLDPYYSTIAHEVGHALGLYHTHEYQTDTAKYSSTSGDYVADTPISCPLYQLVNKDCELKNDYIQIRDILEKREKYKTNPNNLNELVIEEVDILITNLMSYTYKPCRSSLTKEQGSKILYTLQTNRDVRDMFFNFRDENMLNILNNKIKIENATNKDFHNTITIDRVRR